MKYFIALIALTIPTKALAAEEVPEWTAIDTSRSGSIVSALTEDLLAGRSLQTSAKLWIKTDASKDTTVAWRANMQLLSVNCPARSYRVVQSNVFYSDGSSLSEPGTYGVRFAAPGTIIKFAIDILCQDPAPDPASYR